jgi:UDP-2,4-diacetamido-2,4,6-trideoxy-beta-L-altropyranose hydrolase/pseudaminic acid synthase
MRDLVLASHYKDTKIIFATQKLKGNINYKIKEAGYKLALLSSNDLNEFVDIVKKYSADMVVIDHYGIDYKYEKRLKEKTGVKILAFDDTYEKHHCDILLNHNISAAASRYKELVPKGCELWCGSEYTLLREEFMQPFPPKQQNSTTKVLVAMGGVDSKALNIEILKVLEHFSNLEIDLLTTQANKNLAKLQTYVADKAHITLHINTNKMALLMHNADFGIFTPSVTVNEAHFMKLPFIAIQTEENQKDIYEYLKQNNFLVLKAFENDKLNLYIENYLEKNR